MHRDARREAEIVALYLSGATQQDIGNVAGLTRERIRQLLRRCGVPARPRMTRVRLESLDGGGENERAFCRTLGLGAERRAIRHAARRAAYVAIIQKLAAELGRAPGLDELGHAIAPKTNVCKNLSSYAQGKLRYYWHTNDKKTGTRLAYNEAGFEPPSIGARWLVARSLHCKERGK